VIAGGKSSRMGTNKALLDYEGLPLWRRQWALLDQAGAVECAVSVAGGESWRPEGVPVVVDRLLDTGPISGVEAALSWIQAPSSAAATHVMVVAVDLPRVAASWFLELARLCRVGKGAVGRWGSDGFFEPLAAIYPREMLEDAEAAVCDGEFSLQRLVAGAVKRDRMVVREIGTGEAGMFANWNRPEDVGSVKG
jgi:molybdenum cofactor guanylyltransferase